MVEGRDNTAATPDTREALDGVLRAAPILGALLVVLGAKLWLIATYGSPTPFWDQWDAEAATLYPVWRDGRLGLADLLAPHADHRILFTRLLAVGVFELQGRWDPVLQMIAGALLHVGVIGLSLTALVRGLPAGAPVVLAATAALLFGLPFGWENTLSGFQAQFGFLTLFSVAALMLLVPASSFTLRWWLGVAAAGLAFLGMASGGIAVLAMATVALVQLVCGLRRGLREWLGITVLTGLFWLSVRLTPAAAGSGFSSTPLHELVRSVLAAGVWPVGGRDLPVIELLGLAMLLQAPIGVLAVRQIRSRATISHPGWFVLGLWAWGALQVLAMVYGRGDAFPRPRYLDIIAMLVLADVAALLWSVETAGRGRIAGAVAATFAAAWLLLVAGGAARSFDRSTRAEVVLRGITGRIQTERVQAYLASGDIRELQDRPWLHIPYPSAERLAEVLSQPDVRSLLPPILLGTEATPRSGLAAFSARAKAALLAAGPWMGGIGVAMLVMAGVASVAGVRRQGSRRMQA